MRQINYDKILQMSNILKVIGHPLRLKVLTQLEDKNELSVANLQKLIEVEQSLLSHHLRKMKNHGILSCKKNGRKIIYSIQDRHILSIFDCMENCSILED